MTDTVKTGTKDQLKTAPLFRNGPIWCSLRIIRQSVAITDTGKRKRPKGRTCICTRTTGQPGTRKPSRIAGSTTIYGDNIVHIFPTRRLPVPTEQPAPAPQPETPNRHQTPKAKKTLTSNYKRVAQEVGPRNGTEAPQAGLLPQSIDRLNDANNVTENGIARSRLYPGHFPMGTLPIEKLPEQLLGHDRGELGRDADVIQNRQVGKIMTYHLTLTIYKIKGEISSLYHNNLTTTDREFGRGRPQSKRTQNSSYY